MSETEQRRMLNDFLDWMEGRNLCLARSVGETYVPYSMPRNSIIGNFLEGTNGATK